MMSKGFAQIADEVNTALRAYHQFDRHAKP